MPLCKATELRCCEELVTLRLALAAGGQGVGDVRQQVRVRGRGTAPALAQSAGFRRRGAACGNCQSSSTESEHGWCARCRRAGGRRRPRLASGLATPHRSKLSQLTPPRISRPVGEPRRRAPCFDRAHHTPALVQLCSSSASGSRTCISQDWWQPQKCWPCGARLSGRARWAQGHATAARVCSFRVADCSAP